MATVDETTLHPRFASYTEKDLKDCALYLGNSAYIRKQAQEELEYREQATGQGHAD